MQKILIEHINRYIIILFILITLKGCDSPSQSKENIDYEYPGLVESSLANYRLIKPNGEINENLLSFLDLFEIQHEGTIESVNAAMQKAFIRKPGQERWELHDSDQDKELYNRALELLKEMGLVNEIYHFEVDTDYFLLFGGLLARVEKRFGDFLEQYNAQTLHCKNIVLLGGVRKLQPAELKTMKAELRDSFNEFLTKLGKKEETELTEADMLRFVWEMQATKALKDQFHESANLFFINSTDITQGTNQRPTTVSTLEAWLEECRPTPGKCHGNVEQPYGTRMEKNLRTCLEKYSRQLGNPTQKFSITWNSSASTTGLLLSIYKDELARNFYQEYSLSKNLGIIKA